MRCNLGKKSPRRPGEPNTVHLPAHGEGGGRKGNGGSPALAAARIKGCPPSSTGQWDFHTTIAFERGRHEPGRICGVRGGGTGAHGTAVRRDRSSASPERLADCYLVHGISSTNCLAAAASAGAFWTRRRATAAPGAADVRWTGTASSGAPDHPARDLKYSIRTAATHWRLRHASGFFGFISDALLGQCDRVTGSASHIGPICFWAQILETHGSSAFAVKADTEIRAQPLPLRNCLSEIAKRRSAALRIRRLFFRRKTAEIGAKSVHRTGTLPNGNAMSIPFGVLPFGN